MAAAATIPCVAGAVTTATAVVATVGIATACAVASAVTGATGAAAVGLGAACVCLASVATISLAARAGPMRTDAGPSHAAVDDEAQVA